MARDLGEVVDALYGADVASFTQARNGFAAEARKDGDKELAAAIAKLAKPSRSAHAVNLLVRQDPAVGEDLTELGADLRDAEQARDAVRMRELARRRRQVIDGLADQAFDLIGVDEPAAALREEVTATLTAALADPDVAAQILAGALVRPVRWEGFGSVPLSRISALPERPAGKPRAAAGSRTQRGAAAEPDPTEAPAARQLERDRQRQHAADLAAARTAAKAADADLAHAAESLDTAEGRVRDLEVELAAAQRRWEQCRTEVRHARTRQREARRALEKLEDTP